MSLVPGLRNRGVLVACPRGVSPHGPARWWLWRLLLSGKLRDIRVAAFLAFQRPQTWPEVPGWLGRGSVSWWQFTHSQYAKAPLTCIFVDKHGYCSLAAVVR